METQYLKEHLGFLPQCLKEVAEKHPHDPIEYIAQWLKKYVENEKYRLKKAEEARQLEMERELEALEKEHRAKRLEETMKLAMEEAERIKAEEERKAREAASASKLPIVEERDEPASDVPVENEPMEESTRSFGDIKEEDESKAEDDVKDTKDEEGESAEQDPEKTEADEGESPEETSAAAED